MFNLGETVVLTGKNGSGKSRLFKLMTRYIDLNTRRAASEEDKTDKNELDKAEVGIELADGISLDDLLVINYSQNDAPLQSPEPFPTYVLESAKSNLESCGFQESARNALLYIKYISKNKAANNELEEFKEFISSFLGKNAFVIKDGEPRFFDQSITEAGLSPGQQYLLRICVTLFNRKIDPNKKLILLLDEPETHLHPQALLHLIEKVKDRFVSAQIWIATHSLALLATCDTGDIWYMEDGRIDKLRSNSQKLLLGLIGDEEKRYKLQQFIISPDAFASNRFGIECLKEALTVNYKSGDKQVSMTVGELRKQCAQKIVDFGVGKGRLLDGLGDDFPDLLKDIDYFAYDISTKDSEECKSVMKRHKIAVENYFNDIDKLKATLDGGADAVLLVNVLHEISPQDWVTVFKDITALMAPDGVLIILEAEELNGGEKPYDQGFLVIVEPSVKSLFGGAPIAPKRCDKEKYHHLVAYTISKSSFYKDNKFIITADTIINCINDVKAVAIDEIGKLKELHKTSDETMQMMPDTWKHGLTLAFWTHQFANASLLLDEYNKDKQHFFKER